MTVRGYRDLECWQRAMDLVVEGYALTRDFPPEERYSLSNQLQRSLTSVPSNLAEGHPKSTREFLNRMSIAQGELSEAQTQVELACRLDYISKAQEQLFLEHATIVAKQISALMGKVAKRLNEGRRLRDISMDDGPEASGTE